MRESNELKNRNKMESGTNSFELLSSLTYADNRQLIKEWEENIQTITRHTILSCKKMSVSAGEYAMFLMRKKRNLSLSKSRAKQVERITKEIQQEKNMQEKKIE